MSKDSRVSSCVPVEISMDNPRHMESNPSIVRTDYKQQSYITGGCDGISGGGWFQPEDEHLKHGISAQTHTQSHHSNMKARRRMDIINASFATATPSHQQNKSSDQSQQNHKFPAKQSPTHAPNQEDHTSFINFNCLSRIFENIWISLIRPSNRSHYKLSELGATCFLLENSLICKRSDFQLKNSRGFQMECSYYEPIQVSGKPHPCVLYLHGDCSSRKEGAAIAKYLLPLGISLALVDFAGCGISEGEFISFGVFEQHDALQLIHHILRTKPISEFGIWGRSMGAATALLATTLNIQLENINFNNNTNYNNTPPNINTRIRFVVADSCFSSMEELCVQIANEKYKIPKCLANCLLALLRKKVRKKAAFDLKDSDVFLALKSQTIFHHRQQQYMHQFETSTIKPQLNNNLPDIHLTQQLEEKANKYSDNKPLDNSNYEKQPPAHSTTPPLPSLLFLAALSDTLIPSEHSRKLYNVYTGPKRILEFAGTHNSIRPVHILQEVAKFFFTGFFDTYALTTLQTFQMVKQIASNSDSSHPHTSSVVAVQQKTPRCPMQTEGDLDQQLHSITIKIERDQPNKSQSKSANMQQVFEEIKLESGSVSAILEEDDDEHQNQARQKNISQQLKSQQFNLRVINSNEQGQSESERNQNHERLEMQNSNDDQDFGFPNVGHLPRSSDNNGVETEKEQDFQMQDEDKEDYEQVVDEVIGFSTLPASAIPKIEMSSMNAVSSAAELKEDDTFRRSKSKQKRTANLTCVNRSKSIQTFIGSNKNASDKDNYKNSSQNNSNITQHIRAGTSPNGLAFLVPQHDSFTSAQDQTGVSVASRVRILSIGCDVNCSSNKFNKYSVNALVSRKRNLTATLGSTQERTSQISRDIEDAEYQEQYSRSECTRSFPIIDGFDCVQEIIDSKREKSPNQDTI